MANPTVKWGGDKRIDWLLNDVPQCHMWPGRMSNFAPWVFSCVCMGAATALAIVAVSSPRMLKIVVNRQGKNSLSIEHGVWRTTVSDGVATASCAACDIYKLDAPVTTTTTVSTTTPKHTLRPTTSHSHSNDDHTHEPLEWIWNFLPAYQAGPHTHANAPHTHANAPLTTPQMTTKARRVRRVWPAYPSVAIAASFNVSTHCRGNLVTQCRAVQGTSTAGIVFAAMAWVSFSVAAVPKCHSQRRGNDRRRWTRHELVASFVTTQLSAMMLVATGILLYAMSSTGGCTFAEREGTMTRRPSFVMMWIAACLAQLVAVNLMWMVVRGDHAPDVHSAIESAIFEMQKIADVH